VKGIIALFFKIKAHAQTMYLTAAELVVKSSSLGNWLAAVDEDRELLLSFSSTLVLTAFLWRA
jgi:hypothetical protein